MVQLQILNKILKSKSLDIILNNDITDDYFSDNYLEEFNFIVEHYKRFGNVPDIETFISKFQEFDILDVSETDTYLVETITEEYQYHKLLPMLKNVQELMQTNSVEALDYIKSELQSVAVPLNVSCGIDIVAGAETRYNEYLEKLNSDGSWMIPTGFRELDELIGGFAPQEEYVVLVARTNNGKSWVLCKMLEHIWNIGMNVGYISPEMSSSQIGYRFDTLNEHFSNFSLYTGKPVDNYEQYIERLTKNAKNKFVVATPLDFNKKITISKLRKFCQTHKLDVLGIDGITYLSDERYKKGDNKTTSLTNISEDLMSLSCELKIPIIAVVQANRNGIDENGEAPSLESIRDSDGIAHNASKVISLRQNSGNLKMEVTKARNCPVGSKVVYKWNIDLGIFEYNANPGDFSETIPQPQRGRQREVENEQPLVRRGSSVSPF